MPKRHTRRWHDEGSRTRTEIRAKKTSLLTPQTLQCEEGNLEARQEKRLNKTV
jgi:hypothetical protein